MHQGLKRALQLFHSPDAKVRHETLVQLAGEENIDLAIGHGLLVKTDPVTEILCTSCDSGHLLEVQHDQNGKLFSVCSEDSTPNYLSTDSLVQYTLNPTRLLELFLIAKGFELGAVNIKEIESGHFWQLGGIPILCNTYALFFIRDLSLLSEGMKSMMMSGSNPALLYLVNSHNRKVKALNVPILDLVFELNDSGLVMDRNEQEACFLQEFYFDDGKGLQLDKHILLLGDKKKILFNRIGHTKYRNVLEINSQMVNMLKCLYNAYDTPDPSRTLRELADLYASKKKPTISGYKKLLDDACDEQGVKRIIRKDSNQRYGLNPELDCYSQNTY